MPAVCPRRILVAIALCGPLFAFHARAMAQGSSQGPTDQSLSDKVDTLNKKVDALVSTTNDMSAKQKKEDADKAAEVPTFVFQWLSYAGVRVATTTKSMHTYKAEIWEVGGGPSDLINSLNDEAAVLAARATLERRYPTKRSGPRHPLWAGRLISNSYGYSTSLLPLGDHMDDLDRILHQNGWVTIYYVDDIPGSTVRQENVNVIERNVLALHAGMGFTLDPSGSWQTKPEFALAAASRWNSRFSGFVDVRYAYDAPKGSSQTDSNSQMNVVKAQDNSGMDNPLKGVNGTFRANFYGEVLPLHTPSFGFIGGAGIATESDTQRVIAPLRVFSGIRFEVFAFNTLKSADFFGKASGFFQAGYARDPWWKLDQTIKNADGTISTIHHDDQNRLWFEGQVNFNDSKDTTVVYATRVYGDVPTNGKGNSDIRVSVLASIQIQRLLGFASVGSGKAAAGGGS